MGKLTILILLTFGADGQAPDALRSVYAFDTFAECDAARQAVNLVPGEHVAACVEEE